MFLMTNSLGGKNVGIISVLDSGDEKKKSFSIKINK